MSRLYGKYLIVNEKPNFVTTNGCRVRYLSSLDLFEVDLIGTGWTVRDNEADLVRMIELDKFSADEKNEIYYHKLFKEIEQLDLDDNTFAYVSIAEYYFTLTKRTLALCKKQAHLRKLGRVNSAWLKLTDYRFHSRGGRPKGSKEPVVWQNVENYDAIAANCVAHDWYNEFILLERDSGRTNRTEVKWKFLILRYKWKVKNGYERPDLTYENKLKEMNEKYKLGFDF